MIAIITGDIINSRNVQPSIWLDTLKNTLSTYGKTPNNWEIFRGDSFQISVPAEDSLLVAFVLKSEIRKIQNIDVRMGIGIGEINYKSPKITESNGEAFINSGKAFETLKKQTISLISPWENTNYTMNVMLKMADALMHRWTEKSAEAISIKFKHSDLNQAEIAKTLNVTQSTISDALSRAGYDELKELLDYYKNQIKELC